MIDKPKGAKENSFLLSLLLAMVGYNDRQFGLNGWPRAFGNHSRKLVNVFVVLDGTSGNYPKTSWSRRSHRSLN